MAKMQWGWEQYTPENLASGAYTEKELRAEYTRLRSAMEKRVRRAEKAGESIKGIEQYKAAHVPKLKDVAPGDIGTIVRGLVELRNLNVHTRGSLRAESISMTKAVNSLREKYDFVNKKNVKLFLEFMEDQRQKGMGKGFTSERAAQVFASVEKRIGSDSEKRDILMNHYNEWANNLSEIESKPIARNKKNKTMSYYMGDGNGKGNKSSKSRKRK